MATGDIVSVAIGTDGWWADITVEGLSTGGTYAFGLGTNNTPDVGVPKIALTVVSLGFDDTGTATTLTRTVYGTKQVRKAYPNATTMEETAAGGNVTVRVALSDYVYAKDNTGAGNSGTAVTATIQAGFYTQAATPNNAATGVAVTNSSTANYPKVIGNWTWPREPITGATFTLRAVGFHHSARQGRPVRVIKFTAADAHSNTVTSYVTKPSCDTAFGDAVPVTEYVATVSSSALTALDTVTCNFVAYPWIGDSNSVLDTSAGTAAPTPLYGPIARLNDKAATYGTSFASVDSANGNDTTGTVTSASLPTLPFATLSAAYNAVRTYNNTNYSRNNCGNSIIYLRGNASHAWMGGTPTLGTTPDTWLTITTYPGDAQATVATSSGGKSAGLKVKLTNLNLTAQSAGGTISLGNTSMLWVDQCTINAPTASQPLFFNNAVWYLTRCNVVALNQNVAPPAATNAANAIVRGNTLAGIAQVYCYTVLGNHHPTDATTGTWVDFISGETVPAAVNVVIANNIIRGKTSLSLAMGAKAHSHGMAVVQNIVEITTTATACARIAADGGSGDPVNNILLWHNVMVGDRCNTAYNDTGSTAPVRWGWSLKNNIFDDGNIKADTFVTADAARIANWSEIYGVGFSGNINGEISGISAGGLFMYEFMGLSSDQPPSTGSQPPQCTPRAITYQQFVDRKSYNGTTTGAGGGDYRISNSSPAVGLPREWILSFDIAGNDRTPGDESGAYALIAARLSAAMAG